LDAYFPPVLVTGAAGQVGGIGRLLVETLRDRGVPVRAVVRSDDGRAAALRLRGAEIAVADLTRPEQVVPVLDGCTRAYFGRVARDRSACGPLTP
jgi:NAD(P)H dehydrogenase (quinone)